MIYITFERGGPKFSNTTARALAYRTAVQQRQLRAKWLLCSTRFFARKKILCCIVAILLSNDAAVRWASALAVVFENLGPPVSNVM